MATSKQDTGSPDDESGAVSPEDPGVPQPVPGNERETAGNDVSPNPASYVPTPESEAFGETAPDDGLDRRPIEDVMTELRRSIASGSFTPDENGHYHYACPRPAASGTGRCPWTFESDNVDSVEPNVVGHMATEHKNR